MSTTSRKAPPKRVAVYLRVSTPDQTTSNQLRDLKAAIDRHGWELAEVFEDCGVSGAKGRERRPAFDRLLKAVARKEFDLVAAWSVCRLGRSLQDLVSFLLELRGKGVDLYLHQQGLDTSTAAGRMMFQLLGVFAEFERTIIQERVRAGLDRAKSQGKALGRPRVPDAIEQAIRAKLSAHMGIGKIAEALGVGRSTVTRIKKAMAEAN